MYTYIILYLSCFLGASIFVFALQIMNFLHSVVYTYSSLQRQFKIRISNDVYAALLMDHCPSVLDKLSMLACACICFGRISKCMCICTCVCFAYLPCVYLLKCSLIGTNLNSNFKFQTSATAAQIWIVLYCSCIQLGVHSVACIRLSLKAIRYPTTICHCDMFM